MIAFQGLFVSVLCSSEMNFSTVEKFSFEREKIQTSFPCCDFQCTFCTQNSHAYPHFNPDSILISFSISISVSILSPISIWIFISFHSFDQIFNRMIIGSNLTSIDFLKIIRMLRPPLIIGWMALNHLMLVRKYKGC